MELASALPPGGQEPGRFEDIEMLRDRLPRQPEPVLHRQPTAQLEQSLAVLLLQFVQDRPARRRGEGLEHVAHGPQNRQVVTCLSSPLMGLDPMTALLESARDWD